MKISLKTISISIFLLLLANPFLSAQNASEDKGVFRGDFSFSAGTSFEKNQIDEDLMFDRSSGEMMLNLGYKKPKFFISGLLSATNSAKSTFSDGLTYDLKEDTRYTMIFDLTANTNYSANYKIGLQSGWESSARNNFRINMDFVSNLDMPYRVNARTDLSEHVVLEEKNIFSFQTENKNNRKYNSSLNFEWNHKFDKNGRTLRTTFNNKSFLNDEYSEWHIGKTKDEDVEETRAYRITPRYIESTSRLSGQYIDKNFVDLDRLNMEFILSDELKRNRDIQSAANLIEGQWVDSTKYREYFNYLAMTVDAVVHPSYSIGQFQFDASYNPQPFIYTLSNDENRGNLTSGRWGHLFDTRIRWQPKPMHAVSLSFSRTVSRPSYIQTCWFLRSGAYSDEVYAGNPSLKCQSTKRANINYTFTKGRFKASLDIEESYISNKIEKTFNNVEYEGKNYRVYTWINAGNNDNYTSKLSFAWDGSKLKANLSGKYTYFIGVKNNGNISKNSDYSINGSVRYLLKSWTFLINGRYQSKIIRNYNETTSYVGCDFRVDKNFKKFGLFFDARDLLDKNMSTLTYSEDFNHVRIVMDFRNKRMFLLGCKFTF